ncbi:MAG: hypothetical protein MUD14_19885 [Hydrococcus sp. Prado102]|jgi:hypothetical protein|nr:hypothetical protein [Hydrococcus sp. Prado102]
MSNISISNLDLTGSKLFIDSESFMNELSDRELDISGGFPYLLGGGKFPESLPILTVRESVFCEMKSVPIEPKSF